MSTTVTVRDVSDAEIDYFCENGWAHLPGLIGAEHAASLLQRGRVMMERRGREARSQDYGLARFADYAFPDRDDECFRALLTNPKMGENAARLLGRDMAIRTMLNMVAVKWPRSSAPAAQGAGATEYHQDHAGTPAKCNSLVFWIALHEITPAMGSMRFYERSQRLGQLMAPVESWPRLRDYKLSEPLHYHAGDASVHGSLCVHGAPENLTDEPRWSFIAKYMPADAPYTGAAHIHADELGFAVGKPLEHPNFPVVYTP